MKDFLQLIRFPNLIMLGFIQGITMYSLCRSHALTLLGFFPFWALILSTLLIAAGGYVINDYLDIKTDQINKPGRVLVRKKYSRRRAIIIHVALNALALIIITPIYPRLGLLELVVMLLLIKYSSTYKRQPLTGNIMVALFCGISVVMVAFLPLVSLDKPYLWVFSFFAFWATLVREIVKDMEDILGDRMMKCRTLPIVWGIRKTRNLAAILLLLLGIAHPASLLLLGHSYPLSMVYSFTLITLPCILISRKLFFSARTRQFAQVSRLLKWLMVGATVGLLLLRFQWHDTSSYFAGL